LRDWVYDKYPPERYHLPLKTGGVVVGIVHGLWMMHKLQDLLYQNPDLLRAAIMICEGWMDQVKRSPNPIYDDVRLLSVEGVVEKDGSMDEVWRAAIRSACIRADGALMVVNPFKLERAQDKLLVEKIDRDFMKHRRQMGLNEDGRING
jgi:hypothetical protein